MTGTQPLTMFLKAGCYIRLYPGITTKDRPEVETWEKTVTARLKR